ncbi:hypothetical protein VP1G_04226 [Cytospora mali]|uniref:Uncharacterized protein n=1 Tax=Cytospora mali TaxID=578113 RepID=A0A194UZ68_CYTMA|nr:hypothetical protein VP1G_04226 [Valsa mali var. pyri (nom. inval.)]
MRPPVDPEVGVTKKDDDLWIKGNRRPGSSHGWKSAPPRITPRKTIKRIGILLLVVTAVYLFIHNIPTDLTPARSRRPVYTYTNPNSPPGGAPRPNAVGQSGGGKDVAAARRDYDGPVRFLTLAQTLHAIDSTKGSSPVNNNVLFAASSLRSAASLLPLACQMGKELRAYVHFALISRSEIPIQELRDVNGVDDSCHIIFHDARAEFLSISTDERFKTSIQRALYHINNYMHPQAIIVDSSDAEEPLFLRSFRQEATKLMLTGTVIELPEHAEEHVSWITKLDSSSLAQWNRVSVDIVVHAHAGASGSLIRLLKSLSAADYTSCVVPHLTIELPEEIDPPTGLFLQNFQWPPRSASGPKTANLLTLRHRILRRGDTEEESSVRFLESFWPANPIFSHVLVLSPQVELSPNYFHYLKLAILEYRYSIRALHQAWDQRLFSISLDLPTTNLDGSAPFIAPSSLAGRLDDAELGSSPPDAPTPFLWQAPNSNAALFTGEKWTELHGFVSQLLEVQHGLETTPDLLSKKAVSRDYPAWMEHALRLCRARGYWSLYPSKDLAASLATVHGDLYQLPEEYEDDGRDMKHNDEDEMVLRHESLLDGLLKGELLRFTEMPLLSWDDKQIDLEALNEASLKYTAEFRRTVGGCKVLAAPADPQGQDLFCLGDDGI